MESIMLLAIAIVFIVYGTFGAIYPSKIKNSTNESHKAGMKDFGVSEEEAEKRVKKYVEQRNWWYRIMGIICAFFGGMLFYAVVRTLLKP